MILTYKNRPFVVPDGWLEEHDAQVKADAIDRYFKEINKSGLITNDNNLIIAGVIAEEMKNGRG